MMIDLAKRITKRIKIDMLIKRDLYINNILMLNGIAPLKSISKEGFEIMYPKVGKRIR